MAIETRRGCGYRKVHGLYLVGGGVDRACDRLPFELSVCPCCSGGIKPSLGWTWIRPGKFFDGPHILTEHVNGGIGSSRCQESTGSCWFCTDPSQFEKAGLLWIGGRFYKSPAEFVAEGLHMGFSRRIKSVPRGFKAGSTPVFLAHRKAIERPVTAEDLETNAKLEGELIGCFPGIFYVWMPESIEKIFTESERDSEAVKDAEKREIVPVFVPDGDKDHQGTVYDKED